MTIAPESRTSPWRGLPPTVWILVAARAVNRLGAFTLPFLGVVLTVELGATLAQTGLILTVFGLATIPSRIFGGHLADQLGRRSTIVLGLTGCALAQTWIALSSSLWSAVLAVTLLGLVFEIYEPPSQATIADVTEPADRPAAYGLLGSAMAAAAVVAGLLAAALSHWNLRWLFAIDAITCLACAILIGCALPGDTRAAGNDDPTTRTAAWRDRRLLILLLSGTVFAAMYMQLILGLPLTLIERNLPTSSIGILLTVSALTLIAGQRLLHTNRLRTLDDFTCMTIGYVLLAIGLFANGHADNLPAFLAATVIWSLGDLLLLGRYYTIVSAIAPDHARGRYLAVFGISWGIASTVAPLTVTQLLDTTGAAGLWTTAALAAVVLAALQPTIRRQLS
ncbi:putative MFS family arabinose efflux permease [Kribbella orskensis]|uniref:MFS family arabinose efflux permease n=1 Tax=Kribbella orskensis TaxID=2512216 RepID=A0ABY2BCT4_9ACTN|nr:MULTISPECIES: MFS transporter [Kribbella]TCN35132.1 putative MFS family arabinose efflux permease [Kribbella sp. VKM Ac-2500]TCO16499.1 putative MFS family arabinose efflux permease [Kribbella orskensis]